MRSLLVCYACGHSESTKTPEIKYCPKCTSNKIDLIPNPTKTYRSKITSKRSLRKKKKLKAWFVASCVCCLIGLIIGWVLSPELIGLGALIGFFVPTAVLMVLY